MKKISILLSGLLMPATCAALMDGILYVFAPDRAIHVLFLRINF